MNLRFFWIGTTRQAELAHLEDDYLKKIGRHLKVERVTIRELNKTDRHQAAGQLEREAIMIEKKLRPGAYLVTLDEQGQEMASSEFSNLLRNAIDQGPPDITFVVGGAFGIPRQIRNQAKLNLALSRMTLTHEMSRAVLLEQVYRAITIMKGLPYHK